MYYSPILFSEIADLNLTQYHNCEINMVALNNKDRIIIFALHSVGYLIKLIPFLDKVEKPFILISAMEDTELPKEIDIEFMNKLTSNPYFKHWFSVNKTIPNNSQFTSIPYGLNYWTLNYNSAFDEQVQNFSVQNLNFEKIINSSQHFTKRIPKIYSNFHLNLTDKRYNGDRTKLQSIIPRDLIFYEMNRLPRTQSWIKCSNYSFVVSPFGHGYDCIRTFESLCLGCIVIMKKSFLDIIYEDLPVLLVDNWQDINETLLNQTIVSFSTKTFNYEKLKMDYWIKLVNSHFAESS
jgi:hypothetical protein